MIDATRDEMNDAKEAMKQLDSVDPFPGFNFPVGADTQTLLTMQERGIKLIGNGLYVHGKMKTMDDQNEDHFILSFDSSTDHVDFKEHMGVIHFHSYDTDGSVHSGELRFDGVYQHDEKLAPLPNKERMPGAKQSVLGQIFVEGSDLDAFDDLRFGPARNGRGVPEGENYLAKAGEAGYFLKYDAAGGTLGLFDPNQHEMESYTVKDETLEGTIAYMANNLEEILKEN